MRWGRSDEVNPAGQWIQGLLAVKRTCTFLGPSIPARVAATCIASYHFFRGICVDRKVLWQLFQTLFSFFVRSQPVRSSGRVRQAKRFVGLKRSEAITPPRDGCAVRCAR